MGLERLAKRSPNGMSVWFGTNAAARSKNLSVGVYFEHLSPLTRSKIVK